MNSKYRKLMTEIAQKYAIYLLKNFQKLYKDSKQYEKFLSGL